MNLLSINSGVLPQNLNPVTALSHGGENYYTVAKFLMKIAHDILNFFHLENSHDCFIYVYTILVFVVSFGIGWILQWILVKIGAKLSKHFTNDIYVNLVGDKFFLRVCRIVPAILFLILIQFTLNTDVTLAHWLTRITLIYIIILLTIALCSLVDVLWLHVNNRENKRKLPLKGVASLIKGIIVIVASIIIIALIVNKSPGALLAGLGAFAAVLMLVFKDSILGVVAGVQLSDNDSLHVGDWIAAGNANGLVRSVSLTQVKIQNWDKTVSTLPPYSLISNGFTNYGPMQQSSSRLAKRAYLIDANSVVEPTEEMLDDLAKIPLLSDWITKKRAQKAAGKVENVFNSEGLVDGSIETNLGIFRAYMTLYLKSNPNVYQQADDISALFVHTLPQTAEGIPLQLYFFTSTSKWVPYESICSDIFEHIAVMLRRFKLYTYENPSGRDVIIDGYLSGAKDPKNVFGIPEDFFDNNPTAPAGGAQAQ